MSLVLAKSLTMLTVDKVKESDWAISTAGGSSEWSPSSPSDQWSPSSPLWEQMRATEWQCVRHQTLAGHHINHSGERIAVHQGHNLPVYRSLGLHITCQLYHALGLFTACLFHVISQLQRLKARSNIRDEMPVSLHKNLAKSTMDSGITRSTLALTGGVSEFKIQMPF